jgi:hypothetical protein
VLLALLGTVFAPATWAQEEIRPDPLWRVNRGSWSGLRIESTRRDEIERRFETTRGSTLRREALLLRPPYGSSFAEIQTLFDGRDRNSRLTGILLRYQGDGPDLREVAQRSGRRLERWSPERGRGDWFVDAIPDRGIVGFVERGGRYERVSTVLLTSPGRISELLRDFNRGSDRDNRWDDSDRDRGRDRDRRWDDRDDFRGRTDRRPVDNRVEFSRFDVDFDDRSAPVRSQGQIADSLTNKIRREPAISYRPGGNGTIRVKVRTGNGLFGRKTVNVVLELDATTRDGRRVRESVNGVVTPRSGDFDSDEGQRRAIEEAFDKALRDLSGKLDRSDDRPDNGSRPPWSGGGGDFRAFWNSLIDRVTR